MTTLIKISFILSMTTVWLKTAYAAPSLTSMLCSNYSFAENAPSVHYHGGDPDPGVGKYSRQGNTISYAWQYKTDGNTFDFSFDLQLGVDWDVLQEYYAGNRPNYTGKLSEFIERDPYKSVLSVVANELARLAYDNNLSKTELALSFTAALPYDDSNHDIQRFGSECLVDARGDCSDSALLFAGLLREWNIGFVFLHYPGHAAVGVRRDWDAPGSYYFYEGLNYYLAETTGTGNKIGFGLNDSQHGNGDAEIERY